MESCRAGKRPAGSGRLTMENGLSNILRNETITSPVRGTITVIDCKNNQLSGKGFERKS